MPINFLRKTYNHWIANNRDRFKYPPYITHLRKHHFTLNFSRLANELTCRISKGGMAKIYIHNQLGECWDIIYEFDVSELRTHDGLYYCALCTDKKYYPTRETLWEEHVFEAMLDWINKLTNNHWICLFGGQNKGYYEAKLLLKNEINDLKEPCIDSFPVIKTTEEVLKSSRHTGESRCP